MFGLNRTDPGDPRKNAQVQVHVLHWCLWTYTRLILSSDSAVFDPRLRNNASMTLLYSDDQLREVEGNV